jgi:hypothetical protein
MMAQWAHATDCLQRRVSSMTCRRPSSSSCRKTGAAPTQRLRKRSACPKRRSGSGSSGSSRPGSFRSSQSPTRSNWDSHVDIEAVADQLEKFPEVDYVVVTAGSFDLLVETVCEDDDHLLELLNGRIRAIPTVRSTETFVYLKLRKQTYTWGTR